MAHVVPAFAYRFDAADRSIVISGDTTPSANLIKLAKHADVLVHEALYAPGVDRLVACSRRRDPQAEHPLPPHDRRGCRTRPPDDPAITDQMWIDAARVHFPGRVIVGKDLLEI